MYCYLHVYQHDTFTITVSYRSPSSLITDYRSWMLKAQYLKTSYLTLWLRETLKSPTNKIFENIEQLTKRQQFSHWKIPELDFVSLVK